MKACKTNASLLPVMFSFCRRAFWCWRHVGRHRRARVPPAPGRLEAGSEPLMPPQPFPFPDHTVVFHFCSMQVYLLFLPRSALVSAAWLREGPQGPSCLGVGRPRAGRGQGRALGPLRLPAHSTAPCCRYTFAIRALLLLLIIRDASNSSCWSGASLLGRKINVPALVWQLGDIPVRKGKRL